MKYAYNIGLIDRPNGTLQTQYDTVVLAVADRFKELHFSRCRKSNVVLYDIKSILDKEMVDGRL